MKYTLAAVLAAVLALSACATRNGESAAYSQSYQCESGATIVVDYPDTESATLHYRASTHALSIAISASGARYVGTQFEWWTKGAAGTLFQHDADGSTGERLEACTAD